MSESQEIDYGDVSSLMPNDNSDEEATPPRTVTPDQKGKRKRKKQQQGTVHRKKRKDQGKTRTNVDLPSLLEKYDKKYPAHKAKSYVVPGPNSDKKQKQVVCNLCGKTFLALKKSINKHLTSETHVTKVRESSAQASTTQRQTIIENFASEELTQEQLKDHLILHFMAHNIPAFKFEQLFKDGILGEIVSRLFQFNPGSLDRRVFASHRESAVKPMYGAMKTLFEDNKVGYSADESTDSREKSILMHAIYDGRQIYRVSTSLDQESSFTSQFLYREMKNVIEKFGVELKNVVSVTGDNANNLYGAKKLLCDDIKEEKGVGRNVRCLSHGVNLVVRHFVEKFDSLLLVLKAIKSAIGGTPGARKRHFKSFLEERNVDVGKFAIPETRWSYYVPAACHLVQHWDTFKQLLEFASKDRDTYWVDGIQRLYVGMRDEMALVQANLVQSFLDPMIYVIEASEGLNSMTPKMSRLLVAIYNKLKRTGDPTQGYNICNDLPEKGQRRWKESFRNEKWRQLTFETAARARDAAKTYRKYVQETLAIANARFALFPGKLSKLEKDGNKPIIPTELKQFVANMTGKAQDSIVITAEWDEYIDKAGKLNQNCTGDGVVDTEKSKQTETNALSFWECQGQELPCLFETARVLLPTMVTAASNEGGFSQMNYMENDRRLRLSDEAVVQELDACTNRNLCTSLIKEDLQRTKKPIVQRKFDF